MFEFLPRRVASLCNLSGITIQPRGECQPPGAAWHSPGTAVGTVNASTASPASTNVQEVKQLFLGGGLKPAGIWFLVSLGTTERYLSPEQPGAPRENRTIPWPHHPACCASCALPKHLLPGITIYEIMEGTFLWNAAPLISQRKDCITSVLSCSDPDGLCLCRLLLQWEHES